MILRFLYLILPILMGVGCSSLPEQSRLPTYFAEERPFEAVNLNPLFQDHMVLQRGKPVKIWGTTQPGMEVVVRFAGQSKSTIGEDSGYWSVTLDPMKGSFRSRELVVFGEESAIVLKDVLIGDVWIAAGQDNMRAAFAPSELARDPLKPDDDKWYSPHIRFVNIAKIPRMMGASYFDVNRVRLEATWIPVTEANLENHYLSKLAFYFARFVQAAENVPIGIYQAAADGTSIAYWMTPEDVLKVQSSSDAFREVQEELNRPPLSEQEYQAFTNKRLSHYGENKNKLIEAYEAGDIDPATHIHLLSQVRFVEYFRRNQESRQIAKARGWTTFPTLPPLERGNLYSGWIDPVKEMTITGFLWCQGSADGDQGHQYREWNRQLIKSWRENFAASGPSLPFIQVEVPPVDGLKAGMAYLRESQNAVADADPTVGMVNTGDLAPPEDQKGELLFKRPEAVASRMALWAGKLMYGLDTITAGSPRFKSLQKRGHYLIATFERIDNGLETLSGSYTVPHVEVAGEDRVFYKANAELRDNQILAKSDEVPHPVAMRYAFSPYAPVTLFSSAGLPLAAFRSDDWPSPLSGQKEARSESRSLTPLAANQQHAMP